MTLGIAETVKSISTQKFLFIVFIIITGCNNKDTVCRSMPPSQKSTIKQVNATAISLLHHKQTLIKYYENL